MNIFISYSHTDEKIKQNLLKHLSSLKQKMKLKIWDDGLIVPGQMWNNEIKTKLNDSEVVLLLLSSDAMASDYINNEEIKIALKRHEAGEAVIIPIIVRPCNWTDLEVAKMQALPKNAKPLTKWSNRDEAYVDIVKGVQKAILERNTKANTNKNTHSVTIVTGLTSSGKDTLLIYLNDDLYKTKGDKEFHFLTRFTTRNRRIEESDEGSGNATTPYTVAKVSIEELTQSEAEKYFNVFYKYGNYSGFEKSELVDLLKISQSQHIVYINSDLCNIEKHKEEVINICEKSSKNKCHVRIVLVDSNPETSRRRLKARGLAEQVRKKKYVEIDNDYKKILNLKEKNFFDYVVDNTNNQAINISLVKLLEIIKSS